MVAPPEPVPPHSGLTLQVVPDKSLSHRLLFLALLSRGQSRLEGLSPARDVMRTLRVIQKLGARVEGSPPGPVVVQGRGRALREPETPLYGGNSGTTVRLGMGVVAGVGNTVVWYGDRSLRRRPMDRVLRPLGQRGVRWMARQGRFLPVTLRGGSLGPFRGRLEVASAQVKSALLFSGLWAEGPTEIEEPIPTRDHTERLLQHLGVPLTIRERRIFLQPVTELPPVHGRVPGDPSAAAFFATWALMTGVSLRVEFLLLNPRRIRFFTLLQRAGAPVAFTVWEDMPEPVGALEVAPAEEPWAPLNVGEQDVPLVIDEVFLLALLAARAAGESRFEGLGELRVKESDRLETTYRILRASGVDVERVGEGWRVRPGPLSPPREWIPTRDHRMVMLQAVIWALWGKVPPRDRLQPAEISDPWFEENLWRCVHVLASSGIP